MPTTIEINADDTISVKEDGRKGSGGLFAIMATGNAEQVNKLGIEECVSIIRATKGAPFPLGKGEKFYRAYLEDTKANHRKLEQIMAMGLGRCRKAVVELAGEGCNAPTDSYLKIAFDIATGKTPVHVY